jgi:hypothetical protein
MFRISLSIFLTSIIITFVFFENVIAQQADIDTTAKWERIGNLGLNFTNVGMKNWAGGGNDAISVSGLTNLNYNYSSKTNSWTNSLEAGYGIIKLGSEDLRKSDDRLIITSKYGFKAAENLEYSALLDFRTQFVRGYDYNQKKDSATNQYPMISNFMAPGYLNLGIGMNYHPYSFLDIYASFLSNRVIFVLDDSLSNIGSFGVDPGKEIKSELGSTVDLLLHTNIVENVDLKTRLNVFAPYKTFTTMVVNSETTINMKVNSYINAGFSLSVIYDENVNINRDDGTQGPDTQIKHVLSIGFAYKFNY